MVDRDGDGAIDLAFDRPDFSVRELRSNLVLRWEYRPGSACSSSGATTGPTRWSTGATGSAPTSPGWPALRPSTS